MLSLPAVVILECVETDMINYNDHRGYRYILMFGDDESFCDYHIFMKPDYGIYRDKWIPFVCSTESYDNTSEAAEAAKAHIDRIIDDGPDGV